LSVEADADQIQYALLSVLMNAAEAMPTGGEVTIAARKELPAKPSQGTPRCAIEVTDTGEGISKENLPKIFEPFFTTRRDRKQIGLGLTVSKEFLKSNKGDIFIASEKGKGTIVRIVLPLA
jgi:signal transduction histidine kinase